MNPKIKKEYKSTYHRDGTVSHWSTFRQLWVRQSAGSIPDDDFLAMSAEERKKIIRHIDILSF